MRDTRLLFLFVWIGFSTVEAGYCQSRSSPTDINQEILVQRRHEIDTNASAVILFDRGFCSADPNSGTKFKVTRRIKIFKRSALQEWGALRITSNSRLKRFTGKVFNLEGDEIVVSVVEKKDVMVVRNRNEGNVVSSVSFPNVREGSVIEFSYTISIPGYTISPWQFQYNIPVDYSEYEFFFPGSSFGTAISIFGLHQPDTIINSDGTRRKYIMRDIPAFHPEQYMPDPILYRSAITFSPMFAPGIKSSYAREFLPRYLRQRDSLQLYTTTLNETSIRLGDIDHKLTGTVVVTKRGINASQDNKDIEMLGVNNYFSALLKNDFDIANTRVITFDDKNLYLQISCDVNSREEIATHDSLTFINPYIIKYLQQNPFVSDTREYPVDMGTRIDYTDIITFTIPENYSVEKLPDNVTLELPDKSASLSVNSTATGNEITVTTKLKIDKVIYGTSEYGELKEFFSDVVSKRNEEIILRRR